MYFGNVGVVCRIMIIAVVTYLVGDLLSVMGEIQETQAVSEKLQIQVEAVKEENDKMSHALEYRDNPEMLEQVARDRGYIKVGESIFVDVAG